MVLNFKITNGDKKDDDVVDDVRFSCREHGSSERSLRTSRCI